MQRGTFGTFQLKVYICSTYERWGISIFLKHFSGGVVLKTKQYIVVYISNCWTSYQHGYPINKKLNFEISMFFLKKFLNLNFMAPFYRWGSTASRLLLPWGCSLLFITKFPDIPGTLFIDLRLASWLATISMKIKF